VEPIITAPALDMLENQTSAYLLFKLMLLIEHLTLPLKEPVMIFSLVLLIIFLAPLLFSRIGFPSIIGLIVAGILVGPHGFNLLLRDSSIILFGTIGLLYIMFLAGLEIDLNDFKKNRNKSIVFGFFTFAVPMLIGTAASYYILHLSLISSILLSSMFASHTLLAYPSLRQFGVSKNEAVSVTVGGTMITDTAALLVLAVIAGSAEGELNADFWIRLLISFAVFVFIVLWGAPKLGKWFFRNMEAEGTSQFIFVLTVVFGAAFLAELAGLEPIIGAFLAGLALNRLIPATSPLMNRIEFFGNALFIPFFLISVGMLVDVKVIFQGPEAIIVAATMTIVATLSKWLAAFATQKTFGYSTVERNLIFGLSNAQAAATLAAVMIGYNLKLLDINVLNGTILMILVTCLVSSFVTESAGRKLAIAEASKPVDLTEAPERILIPVSNPDTIDQLMELAVMVKNPYSPEPLFPMAVVKDGQKAQEQLLLNTKMLEKAHDIAAATENTVQTITRVDYNVASGILRAIKETMISDVIIGWNARLSTRERIFGSVLDQALTNTEQTYMVSRLVSPLNTTDKIVVVVPKHAEVETGFYRWLETVKALSRQTGAPIHLFGSKGTLERIEALLLNSKPAVEAVFSVFEDLRDFLVISREITANDLLVVISARRGTLSYQSCLDKIPKTLSKHFNGVNFVIIYPQQKPVNLREKISHLNEVAKLPVNGEFRRATKAGLTLKRLFGLKGI
jgi:Kef-type K+ transport system membrane component KefB